ncbi:MAG: methyl-accepting chemotaxis protein [Spirochaetales bacterium]|nr:methyl-accepting chemotaxis protein [Spirochaetales bacterium]
MSKRTKGKASFSRPMIILVVLILTCAFLLQVLFISSTVSSEFKEIQSANFSTIVMSLSELLEREILSNEKLLHSYAHMISLSMEKGDQEIGLKYHDIIMALFESSSYYESSYILDLSGKVVDTTYSTSMIGRDLSDHEYFTQIRDGNKSSYTSSEAILSEASGKYTIAHSTGILRDGKLAGVLVVTLKLSGFSNAFILSKRIGKTGYPYILDSQGLILVHPSKDLLYSQSQEVDPFFSTVLESTEKMQTISYSLGGKSKQGAFVRMPGTNWLICLAIDDDEAFRAIGFLKILLVGTSTVLIVLISLILGAYVRRKLVVRVSHIEDILHQVSQGDLTLRGEVRGRDEVAAMAGHFNIFLEELNSFVSGLKNRLENLGTVGEDLSANMEETAAAVHQIRTNVDSSRKQIDRQIRSVDETVSVVDGVVRNIQNLEDFIDRQADTLQEGSSAVEEMIAQIRTVSSSAEEAEGLMVHLDSSSRAGQEKLKNVDSMISSIALQSQKLESANTLIAGIAAQTNLLAMNAAIEAAHAGDAGRGFAVVADEIRKLAEQSRSQSAEVKETIREITSAFEIIVEESRATGLSFAEILSDMDAMSRFTAEIKSSMEEQVSGSSQVLQSLQDMRNSGADVKLASRKMSEENKRILETTRTLSEISTEVSSAINEIGNGMDEISRSVVNVGEISVLNRDSIGFVKNEASRYQTEESKLLRN